MANSSLANTIHIDSVGAVTVPKNIKITGFFFTANAAKDTITLKESASGTTKMIISGGTAGQTDFHRLGDSYIVFSQGLYVSQISAGASACLIISTSGGIN